MNEQVNISIEEVVEAVQITVDEISHEIAIEVIEDQETVNIIIAEVGLQGPSGISDAATLQRITDLENNTQISSHEQITINEAQADFINA